MDEFLRDSAALFGEGIAEDDGVIHYGPLILTTAQKVRPNYLKSELVPCSVRNLVQHDCNFLLVHAANYRANFRNANA